MTGSVLTEEGEVTRPSGREKGPQKRLTEGRETASEAVVPLRGWDKPRNVERGKTSGSVADFSDALSTSILRSLEGASHLLLILCSLLLVSSRAGR